MPTAVELQDDPEESHRPEDEAEENRKLVTSILDKFGQLNVQAAKSRTAFFSAVCAANLTTSLV